MKKGKRNEQKENTTVVQLKEEKKNEELPMTDENKIRTRKDQHRPPIPHKNKIRPAKGSVGGGRGCTRIINVSKNSEGGWLWCLYEVLIVNTTNPQHRPGPRGALQAAQSSIERGRGRLKSARCTAVVAVLRRQNLLRVFSEPPQSISGLVYQKRAPERGV